MSEEVKDVREPVKVYMCGGILLSGAGKKEFNRIKNQLKKERGKLYVTPLIETAIASLAQQIDFMNEALNIVAIEGMTIQSGREGETTKSHPALNIVKEYQTQVRLSLIELGMTPKSRAAMNIAIAEEIKANGFAAAAAAYKDDDDE
ncbi:MULTISPECIES: phage terminase small subunit P27 family [Aeromonas]|uniref:phage terminase small subunit P27 family n=1 Tax=Aeromonas TaxID=642 RepID=UPI00191EBB2B|nr:MULTISPECIES: phage terminase small subunit P27 family [Aeromonas]MBL0525224.1 phage terminase small subunit P27 family [Aeromonas dhakensis]